MKKYFNSLIIILLLNIFFSENAKSFNPNLAAMLQDTLNSYVSQISNIKGMSASVFIPGQGIWQGCSGVSYTGQPITQDMKFGIASNSKLFVAAIMLKLHEDGILSLNDSVRKWLPNYPNVNPNITIRQLLNHTSGVTDPIFVSPWMDTIMAHPTRVFTPTEVLSWLGAPKFAPGAGWNYSNVNYILVGMIAKSATNFSISRLIRDSILNPLNMDSTFYDIEESSTGIIAHRWYNSKDYNDTSRVGLNSAGGCAGSIFSTSSEMAQWYHALFSGQVINSSSMAELTSFVATSNPDYDYGLGLDRSTTLGVDYWGHGGSTWGYKSKMIYDTCLGVVVCGLTNSFPAGMDGVTFLLYRVVLNHVPKCAGVLTGSTSVCQGQSGVVYTVPAISGATSYIWTLPNGATGTSITNSITVNFGLNASSGTLMVSGVNDFGAGGNASIFINVNPLPSSAGTISGVSNICLGQDSITYSVPTIPNATSYIWTLPGGATGASTTNIINVKYGPSAVSGNIIVKGINTCGEGVSSEINIIVNPTYNFTENKTICQGVTYDWRGNTYSTSDTYTANYTTINGCDSIYTLNLKVNPVYNFTESHSICQGETYNWHGKTYTSSNTYTAFYTTINGCDSVYKLNLKVNPVYSITEEKNICKGTIFNWHGEDYSKSGEYLVKYTTINGCDSTYKLNLTIDSIPTGVSLKGTTASADSLADSYQWLDCDKGHAVIDGAIEKNFKPTKTGNYAVLLKRGDCSDTSKCIQIIITDVEDPINKNTQYTIYPNPANNTLIIQGKTDQISTYKIINLFGQTMLSGNLSSRSIDISNLLPGIYFIRFKSKETLMQTTTFIKE